MLVLRLKKFILVYIPNKTKSIVKMVILGHIAQSLQIINTFLVHSNDKSKMSIIKIYKIS